MRVLIACERFGKIRDAFLARGHDAWSCDIAPSSGRHIQSDVLTVINEGWDLMISHPECTDLSSSGASHFPAKRADGRQQAAIDFFMKMVNAPIPMIAIENPIGIMSTIYRKPDQIIQPYQFGHDASKATCLWLKGLSVLKLDPAQYIEPRIIDGKKRWSNQTDRDRTDLHPVQSAGSNEVKPISALLRQWQINGTNMPTKKQLQAELEAALADIALLKMDKGYGILTRQGLDLEIERRQLELDGAYAIFLDIDYLHQLNSKYATYEPVNEMIRKAFTLRHDDLMLAGKWQSGDEIVFIVRSEPTGFIARLNESLAAQGISATTASVKIKNNDLMAAVMEGASLVKASKEQRDIISR